MLKKIKEKLDSFNSQFAYCAILPSIFAYFIPLERPSGYALCKYDVSRGIRQRPPKYCDHSKNHSMGCFFFLVLTNSSPYSAFHESYNMTIYSIYIRQKQYREKVHFTVFTLSNLI